MSTGSIQTKNKTLRKFFENEKLSISLLNGFAGTLTEGQEVVISGDETVTKRTSAGTFPIGYVKVGGAQNERVAIVLNATSELSAKAIGGALAAGAFVRPNGNADSDGVPEYVAATTGYAMAIVLKGAAENGEMRILLLDNPVAIA